MEREDWEELPGGSYTRAFIRTYASFLGLDGPRLAEDYRHASGEPKPGERGAPRADPVVSSDASRRAMPGRRLAVAAAVALIVVVVAAGLLAGGESNGGDEVDSGRTDAQREQPATEIAQKSEPGVSVRLAADAEVWVCLLDAAGVELVDGRVLAAGAEEGPFRSGSFTVSLGNGEVSMWVDGQSVGIPESSSPLGYEIDGDGELTQLLEAERPTCV